MSGAYQASGVDYDLLDAGKRVALAAALGTSALVRTSSMVPDDDSRGEPAFVFDFEGSKLAMVMECLGTKSSLAREFQEAAGVDRFDWVGFDTVAAIVNDLCSTGALPLVVNAYFATGSPSWYAVEGRFGSLVRGFESACRESNAVWGGGESPMLGGIVADGEIDLAGASVGHIPGGRPALVGSAVRAGDEIVMVASSGLHTNGSSLGRRVASLVKGGLTERLPDGEMLGDALLRPSALYVSMLAALYEADLPLSYASHITGHGLRKIMRANQPLTYRLTSLLPVPTVLQYLADTLELSPRDAYGTLNMGNGFALFCPVGRGAQVAEVCRASGHVAELCGVVETGARQVVLEPLGLSYTDDELQLRPEALRVDRLED
jgi:phosphoribosylformylglycinamidine cyclo-ligase